jgi:16S rRNA pseudouridine516 synthase
LLESETKPLLPAGFEALSETSAMLTLHEGRYHQVRRMFAAVGNHVASLKRVSIGGLKLPEDLEVGTWRKLTEDEAGKLFAVSGD